jgi:carbon-monoxide dehydrogenase small subunit
MRVNGTEVRPADPAMRLLDYLRDDLDLRAAKEGCGMGECGSCTVLVDGDPVCSCLVLVGQVASADIRTAEGLAGDEGTRRLREELVDRQAVQCGFCVPGVLVSACALLDSGSAVTDRDIRVALEGNLCRCTGYQRMVEAIRAARQG